MDYQKTKSGLWVPKPLRNQRGFIAPGMMPPPLAQGGPAIPSSGLFIWLVMPIAGLVNNDTIDNGTKKWPDSGSSGIDGLGPGGANPKPVYNTNIIDGIAGVDTSGAGGNGSQILFTGFNAAATGWSGATLFVVCVSNTDAPGVDRGLTTFGYSTSKHPDTSSHIWQDSFSTNATRDCGDPSGALTTPHLLMVTSATNDFNVYYNGSLLFNSGTNTFVNNLSPFFEPSLGVNNLNQPFNGYISEFGIYDHVLDSTERGNLNLYIAARFPSTGM